MMSFRGPRQSRRQPLSSTKPLGDTDVLHKRPLVVPNIRWGSHHPFATASLNDTGAGAREGLGEAGVSR